MKMKTNKTRNELKVLDSNTYRLKTEERMKNGRRTTENLHGFAHGNVSEALWKYLSLETIFWWKQFFFTWNTWNTQHRGWGSFLLSPLPYLYEKKGGSYRPARPGEVCSPRRASGFLKKLPEAPPFTKFTPHFRNLWKSYRSFTEACRTWFSSSFFFLFPFTNFKWNMLIQDFRNFSEALRRP